jgi:hypothetical protein
MRRDEVTEAAHDFLVDHILDNGYYAPPDVQAALEDGT